MENIVVTVARGFGSGGKVIASMVAEELNIKCYENRILTLASQLSGYDEAEFVKVDEKLRGNFITTRLRQLSVLQMPKPVLGRFQSDDKLFQYQSTIIRELAEKESCVIVGKCADYVLRDHKNVVSVYIEAPREYCRNRIMNRMMVSAPTADKMIEETDQYRAEYYKYYSGGNYWTNPVNYDITLNPARLGVDQCVKLILECVRYKKEQCSSPEE